MHNNPDNHNADDLVEEYFTNVDWCRFLDTQENRAKEQDFCNSLKKFFEDNYRKQHDEMEWDVSEHIQPCYSYIPAFYAVTIDYGSIVIGMHRKTDLDNVNAGYLMECEIVDFIIYLNTLTFFNKKLKNVALIICIRASDLTSLKEFISMLPPNVGYKIHILDECGKEIHTYDELPEKYRDDKNIRHQQEQKGGTNNE